MCVSLYISWISVITYELCTPANQTCNPNPRNETTYFVQSTRWLEMQQHFWFCAAFQTMSQASQMLTQHETTPNKTRSSLHPTRNPQTQRETTVVRFFINLGSTISTDTKRTNMQCRHLSREFQLHEAQRLRAPDIAAGCINNVVSCGVWFDIGRLWSSETYLSAQAETQMARGSFQASLDYQKATARKTG